MNHLSYEACRDRYPRLVRCMQFVACLSEGEAACAIRDWRSRSLYGLDNPLGGEAVCHFGGCLAVLLAARRCRSIIRRLDGGTYRKPRA